MHGEIRTRSLVLRATAVDPGAKDNNAKLCVHIFTVNASQGRIERILHLMSSAAGQVVGASNAVSGLLGGYAGSYIFSQTIFNMRAGVTSRITTGFGTVMEVLRLPAASETCRSYFRLAARNAVWHPASSGPQSFGISDSHLFWLSMFCPQSHDTFSEALSLHSSPSNSSANKVEISWVGVLGFRVNPEP